MSKYSIVLAEDSSADVFLTRRALIETGLDHELYVVEDVDGAVSLMNRIGVDVPKPDLLLIDLNLPKVDGADLIQMIRRYAGCAHLPVIVVTSSDSPKDRARVSELKVKEYFRKPSDLAEFMRLGELVRDTLENRDALAPR